MKKFLPAWKPKTSAEVDVMILKTFSPKKMAKNCLISLKVLYVFVTTVDRDIGFRDKNTF
jgi:hypothetical protein